MRITAFEASALRETFQDDTHRASLRAAEASSSPRGSDTIRRRHIHEGRVGQCVFSTSFTCFARSRRCDGPQAVTTRRRDAAIEARRISGVSRRGCSRLDEEMMQA